MIFGRDPAFWTGVVKALLAMLISFGLFGLTPIVAGGILAAVSAVLAFYVAWTTNENAFALGIGAAEAIIALGVTLGLHWNTDQIAAIMGLVTIVLGVITRTQVSPLARPTFKKSQYELAA